MKKVFALLLCVGMFGQNFNTSDFNINSNFNIIQSEITAAYTQKKINYSGNRYYFKKPKNALLFLFDDSKPFTVKTNFNLLEQTFDIIDQENKKLKLLSNKVSKVVFDEKSFISLDGKFYELLAKNEIFSLISDTFLETFEPSYTPGIQEKPELTYRRKNSILLYVDNKFKKIERRKKFILSMFSSTKSKEINSFMKKNKISPSNNKDLSILFLEFYEYLIL